MLKVTRQPQSSRSCADPLELPCLKYLGGSTGSRGAQRGCPAQPAPGVVLLGRPGALRIGHAAKMAGRPQAATAREKPPAVSSGEQQAAGL